VDYCECGAQATSRCSRCGAFLCRSHERRYPPEILYALYVDGRQAPLTLSRPSGTALQLRTSEDTRLCRTCRADAVDETMPEVIAMLGEFEGGSAERVALRLVDAGCWALSDPGGTDLVAPAIVAKIAGRRPAWLRDDALMTMTILYATLARARSIKPPVLRVIHENAHTTVGWWSGEKRHRKTTDLGTVNAWLFSYEDDGHFCGLLVGPHGAARGVGLEWAPEPGKATNTCKMWGNGEYGENVARARAQLAQLQREVAADPPVYTRDSDSRGFGARMLVSPIRALLR